MWHKLREFPFGSLVVPPQSGRADLGSVTAY
ncbi:2'-5' RNA ligase family protein [Streptomyces hirsutus]